MKLYQIEGKPETKTVLSQEAHYSAFEAQGFKCLGECDKNGKLIEYKETKKAKAE